MNMDWLNLPIVEVAFAFGGFIGIVAGFWAGYSVENIASYQKGYKRGREKGRMEADNAKLMELVSFIMHQCNDGNPRCDECIGWNDGECMALLRMRELGVEVSDD